MSIIYPVLFLHPAFARVCLAMLLFTLCLVLSSDHQLGSDWSITTMEDSHWPSPIIHYCASSYFTNTNIKVYNILALLLTDMLIMYRLNV